MSEVTDPERELALSTRGRVIGGIALLIVVIVLMWLLVEHDASGELPQADRSIGAILRDDGYLVGFALIYIEEWSSAPCATTRPKCGPKLT